MLLFVCLAGALAATWLITWFLNGGWPGRGPTKDPLPRDIAVTPANGDRVNEFDSFCVQFEFQAEDGFGSKPSFYFDGRNVTKNTRGLVTLDKPPSGGVYCYKPDTATSGWHTVKVIYSDSKGENYQYRWRFQVTNQKSE